MPQTKTTYSHGDKVVLIRFDPWQSAEHIESHIAALAGMKLEQGAYIERFGPNDLPTFQSGTTHVYIPGLVVDWNTEDAEEKLKRWHFGERFDITLFLSWFHTQMWIAERVVDPNYREMQMMVRQIDFALGQMFGLRAFAKPLDLVEGQPQQYSVELVGLQE